MRTLVIGLYLLIFSMVPIQVQADTALDTIKSRVKSIV